jgi:phosphoesterase RecJ-like protein
MTNTRPERLKQAAAQIRQANRILLACHLGPDADALGSLLGLALGLTQLGKQVDALCQDGVPELYHFLPGWERVRTSAPGPWDLSIGMDADGSDRLGAVEALVLAQPFVIDLDHHTGPDPYGDLQVVDPTAAATGELVYALLTELGATVTPEIATCLLAAILTDTGSFRFTNVTPDTFRIAGELVSAGARPAPIYDAVYGSRPFAATRLLGRLLENMDRSADGRIVWAGLSQSDFQRIGLDMDATEGFVDQLRMVEGAEVALFLREQPDGAVRVSMRSRGAVNVAKAAEEFDGGGHVPAAGATLPGPLAEATRRVVAAVQRQMM